MNGDGIDKNIRHYYKSHALSPDVLARMNAMAKAQNNDRVELPEQKKQNIWQRGRYVVAASFVLIVLASAQLTQLFQAPEGDNLAIRVAQEVALNHNKQLASEFISDNYPQLAATMGKLDFTIQSPKKLKNSGYTLLGARYCSIQGHIAAQIKLLDQQGESATLYITRHNDSLASLKNQRQLHENLLISNWHEGELFYALAHQQ